MHSDIDTAAAPATGGDSPLASAAGRRTLEQAIVDTVRDPLLVLDGEFRVVTASRSYYSAFKVNRADTGYQLLHAPKPVIRRGYG